MLKATHSSIQSAFLHKLLLISFWLGVHGVVLLLLTTAPVDELIEHGFVVITVLALLLGGTGLSLFFIFTMHKSLQSLQQGGWASKVLAYLISARQSPHRFIGLTIVVVSVALVLLAMGLNLLRDQQGERPQLGRADLALADKCAEVARLERKLFQTNEQFVMAQCLIQYDQKYAAIRKMESGS